MLHSVRYQWWTIPTLSPALGGEGRTFTHYLALLEHKSRALDQAAPLDGWQLADCIHRLRRLMEARMGNAGRRDFTQVLRLMENFHQHQVEHAVSEALRHLNYSMQSLQIENTSNFVHALTTKGCQCRLTANRLESRL